MPPFMPFPQPLPPDAQFVEYDGDEIDHEDDPLQDGVPWEVVDANLATCSDDVTLSLEQEYLEWHTPTLSDSEAQVWDCR